MSNMHFDFKLFWPNFLFYLDSLANYEFYLFNPLFWIALCLLLLILIRRWDTKKAFSFCVVIAIILLGTTQIESRYLALFHEPNQFFDSTVIKLISAFVTAMVLLLYIFLV
jgi:hypothetical protein